MDFLYIYICFIDVYSGGVSFKVIEIDWYEFVKNVSRICDLECK